MIIARSCSFAPSKVSLPEIVNAKLLLHKTLFRPGPRSSFDSRTNEYRQKHINKKRSCLRKTGFYM